MQVVKLRIHDKVYEKLMWLLGKFSKDEVEIITDDNEFSLNQNYLVSELKEIYDGNATFVDIDEADKRLEDVIKKHEDSI
jgi:hypothetical protein